MRVLTTGVAAFRNEGMAHGRQTRPAHGGRRARRPGAHPPDRAGRCPPGSGKAAARHREVPTGQALPTAGEAPAAGPVATPHSRSASGHIRHIECVEATAALPRRQHCGAPSLKDGGRWAVGGPATGEPGSGDVVSKVLGGGRSY
ncbi:hypothetical protein Sm713_13380 [Streptomyces sp. TS71-3]|nr:hypothetical protein Sm713_13380 [Streptomyces sp. TS71-3]